MKRALIFAVVAIIAGLLGFGGIAGAAAGIAKLLAIARRGAGLGAAILSCLEAEAAE